MSSHPHAALVTLDEYLAAEEAAEFRSEFIDGEVVAMVGGTLEHGVIVHNVERVLGNQVLGRCRVVSQGTHVRVLRTERVFYPDVAVFCSEPQRERRVRDLLLNPSVIVEVLSPGTADYDRGTKWANYRQIPSLQDYLLVSQDEPRVERYTRQGDDGFWLFRETTGLEATLQIESIEAELHLRDVYYGVQLAGDAG